MATQASLRRIWRDTHMLNVLFACSALSASLIYFMDGGPLPHFAAPAAPPAVSDNAELFTGAIIVVPRGGYECWRLMFDNRTGHMWAGSYVDCNAVTETMENRQKPVLDSARMQAISAGFHK